MITDNSGSVFNMLVLLCVLFRFTSVGGIAVDTVLTRLCCHISVFFSASKGYF